MTIESLLLLNNRADPNTTKRLVGAIKFTARQKLDASQVQTAIKFTARTVLVPCNITTAIAFTAVRG